MHSHMRLQRRKKTNSIEGEWEVEAKKSVHGAIQSNHLSELERNLNLQLGVSQERWNITQSLSLSMCVFVQTTFGDMLYYFTLY